MSVPLVMGSVQLPSSNMANATNASRGSPRVWKLLCPRKRNKERKHNSAVIQKYRLRKTLSIIYINVLWAKIMIRSQIIGIFFLFFVIIVNYLMIPSCSFTPSLYAFQSLGISFHFHALENGAVTRAVAIYPHTLINPRTYFTPQFWP